jgi:hypothetical protein
MLAAAFSASRRSLFLLVGLAGTIVLSLGLSGCAGVVGTTNAGTSSTPSGTLSISNIQASGATSSSVQLSWATNQPSTSAIVYGTTTGYGESTPVSSTMVTTHQMALGNLAQGTTYHFQVRSTNGSETASSSDQTFSTMGNNAPPSVQVTSPAPGATLSGKVNLTAVASDGGTLTGVQFRIDGNNVGPNLAASPYLYVFDSSTLSNGSHSITAVATDNAGNSASSTTVPVKVDNTVKDTTPPTVSLTSPANGATVSGTVAVTASASDNVSVASVQFQLDGANLGPADVAAPYVFSWDSTKIANGAHSLSAIATDSAGNVATSATIKITVNNTTKDTTPPTVSITAPANGAKVSGVVAVTANASDNVSVAGVQFAIDGVNVGAPDLAAPYAYSWDTSKSPNGPHTLKAVATDGAGNSTTSATVTVTVNNTVADTTPPTVAVTAPAASATVAGMVNVTATASDNVGVASVQFQVDGVNAGGLDGATPYAYAWDTTKVANGVHRLDAIAKDAAGNATTSAIVSVTVNNATATNFSIAGTITGPGSLGATVTLSGAGVAATTTNAGGAYTFTGLAKGAYTVTPSHVGFNFNPGSQNATVTNANITGVNFAATAATAQTFSISGTIAGSGGSGSTVTLTGTSSATTTANASGAYTFPGLAKGTYTVSANHTGFTFAPASLAESVTTANITGANFTATAVAPQTFSISGTISGSGGSGATVSLTGTSSATTTASASGAFTFTGLAKGNYTVTPSHTGFTFNPASLAESVTTANITGVNFADTAVAPQTFSISGTISGSGGSGATVSLTGTSSAATTANASGVYTFTGLAKGTYTVSASHTGFTFSPASLAEAVTTANITGANFTATAVAPQTFSISGTISGSGGSGATVSLTGTSTATTTANASGMYTFTGLAKGNYTVTPSHSGFTFSPASLAESITTASIAGANFTATAVAPQTFSISGTISGSGGSGTTLTLSGAASQTTTANSSGAFTFTGLSNGTYAITPSHTGFTFSPTSQSATVSSANVTGVNFTATAAPTTFTISGTITPSSGGSGATVTLSGAAAATTTTNASGAYSFTGLANGGYTVTPSNSGFKFTPASINVTISGANKTGVNFTATASTPPSVKLSWNASTSTVSGYNVYRSTTSGSGYTKLNSSPMAATTYTDTTVQSGNTYYYVTTSVNSAGEESADSNQATAVIP